ncbi:phosphopantothenoylcysteine decarboxylase [Leptolyngbya valderiana BDU 20041]|nr:phosphopantothenoylcysteine decarboxylase [Leptolyngbya valderiana BDU 20041]
MSHPVGLKGKRWVLGVSGGIAAYKAPFLVRRMREAGAEVRVVLTRGAAEFVTPLTLQAVSGQPVHQALLDPAAEAGMGHIELARWADGVLIAPATAHLIGKLANGLADDLLTTLVLATEAPVILAPAMNRVMWAAPAVARNCRILTERGIRLLGPAEGDQACGETGPGRMLEPDELVQALQPDRDARLAGRRFVITAGPTLEPLDPVRFLGNRSSGKMGFALAQVLAEAGATVDLIAGPVQLGTPAGVRRIDVQTAEEMQAAVSDAIPGADGFIGVAAVADYRPAERQAHKIKKSDEALELRLIPNPDILAGVASSPHRPTVVMGFAAETRDLEGAARAKLESKGLDLIAANRVGERLAFDQADNALEVYCRDRHWSLERQDKRQLAVRLVAIVAQVLHEKSQEKEGASA